MNHEVAGCRPDGWVQFPAKAYRICFLFTTFYDDLVPILSPGTGTEENSGKSKGMRMAQNENSSRVV
jgi:hypothetical protein